MAERAMNNTIISFLKLGLHLIFAVILSSGVFWQTPAWSENGDDPNQIKANCLQANPLCKTDIEPNDKAEIERIKCWLRCLSRDPKVDEPNLFTYGPKPKIADMKAIDFLRYYDKLYATQDKSEELVTRNLIKQSYDEFVKKKYIDDAIEIDKSIGNLNALNALLEQAKQNFQMDQDKQMLEAKKALLSFVAFNMIYKDFLKNIFITPENELKKYEREYKKCENNPDTVECRRIEGKVLGLRLGVSSARQFDYSTTAGRGIYMSTSPTLFISHFPDGGGGLKCSANGQKIVNISFLEEGVKNIKILRDVNILIPLDGPHPIYNATKYNKYVAPYLFEEAAKHFIVMFSNQFSQKIYCSKYAINMKACDKVNASDMTQTELAKLMENLHKVGLLNFLLEDDSVFKWWYSNLQKNNVHRTTQAGHFYNLINQDPKKCDYARVILQKLKARNDPALINIFAVETATQFNALLDSCNITETELNQALGLPAPKKKK
jgi:hypothetical protein